MLAHHFAQLVRRSGQPAVWIRAADGGRFAATVQARPTAAPSLSGAMPQPAVEITLPADRLPPGISPDPGDAIEWAGRRYTVDGLPVPITARGECIGWRLICLG